MAPGSRLEQPRIRPQPIRHLRKHKPLFAGSRGLSMFKVPSSRFSKALLLSGSSLLAIVTAQIATATTIGGLTGRPAGQTAPAPAPQPNTGTQTPGTNP